MEYYVFSDESRYTQGRYRSIAAISLPADHVGALCGRLAKLLSDAHLQELKWSDLRGRKRIQCATAFLEVLIEEVLSSRVRVDSVTWDTEDSRHRVKFRDDIRNCERMFFHLHRFLMGKREPGARWHLRPDEQVQFDWETIKSCLSSDGTWRSGAEHPVLSVEFAELLPILNTIREVKSERTPLCQLADLLAGIVPYSRDRANVVLAQLNERSGQGSLFDGGEGPGPSARDRIRFPLMFQLYGDCKRNRLGVSLESRGYLKTRDPNMPINFWHYEPQHEDDKAPTRDG